MNRLRLLFRVGALSLTFMVGSAATYLSHRIHIQFRCTALAHIIVEPDGYGESIAFESYDGVKLWASQAGFPSREAAAAAFQRSLIDAVKVIEREPLYDRERGKVVGERVVAILPPNERVQSEWASVIYLDDRKLYQISSLSLRHALAYDRGNPHY